MCKKSKQAAREKSAPRENEVEAMNDLDLISIFLSLLKEERNVTVQNAISPPRIPQVR